MKSLFKKENLFIRIAIGFGAGILLGTMAPGFSVDIKVLGDVYLNLIKMMVIPVLICAVMTGILNSAGMASLKRVAVKTIILYVAMFLASFAVAFAVAMLIRPGLGVVFENQPVYEGEVGGPVKLSEVLLGIFPDNIFAALSAGNILPTMLFSMLLSAAIVSVGEKGRPVTEFINGLSAAVFRLLSIIMETSPVGVMSLMAFSIAQYGTGLFMAIGKYILCCWLACIAVFIIVFLSL